MGGRGDGGYQLDKLHEGKQFGFQGGTEGAAEIEADAEAEDDGLLRVHVQHPTGQVHHL